VCDHSSVTDYPLRSSLGAIKKRMLIDFEEISKQIEHRGAKGRTREITLAQEYLRHYLPRTVELVHGGELVDSKGSRSAECDLIIQSQLTPPLITSVGFDIVPIEWAYGIVEVKSNLTRPELRDAQQKICRAKQLRKLTFRPQTGDIRWSIDAYGQRFDHFPLYGCVFAYTSTRLDALLEELWSLQQGLPLDQWVDIVIVLDNGLLMYANPPGGPNPRPEPGCHLLAMTSSEPLIPATLALQTVFSGVFERQASLAPYLGPEAWGETIGSMGPPS
jgi:hypothetical protein